jgi:hypothetical protein
MVHMQVVNNFNENYVYKEELRNLHASQNYYYYYYHYHHYRHYYSNQMKEGKMDEACSTNGRHEKCIQNIWMKS